MKRIGLALAALVLVCGAVALYRSSTDDVDASAATSHAGAAGGGAVVGAAQGSTVVDTRIEAVRSENDLLAYFDQLEAEVRARGRLDNELARADLAGRRLLQWLPKEQVARRMFDFGDRMRRLEIELRVGPVMAELDKLREQIAHEANPAKRQALLQQYAQKSAKLDVPTARLAAAEKLKAVL